MNPYAFLSLFASIVTLFLGNFIYYKNPKNRLNQLIAVLCFLVAYLSFVNFSLRNADSYQTAYLWLKASVLWPLMSPIVLTIVLTATKNRFSTNKVFLTLIYIPSILISLLQVTSNQLTINIMVMEYWGWTSSLNLSSPFLYLTMIWIFLIITVSIVLCYSYYRKTRGLEKQQTLYILLGLIFAVIVSLITDTIIPLLSIEFPGMVYFAAALGVLFISYGVSQYKLPSLTPEIAADEIVSTIKSFLIMTDDNNEIKYVNPAGLNLLGQSYSEISGEHIESVLPNFGNQKNLTLEGNISVKNFETLLKDKNGNEIPVLLSTSVITKKSSLIGVLYVGTDISERKAVERKRKALSKQTIKRQSVLLELYKEDISNPEATLKRLTETDSKTLDVDRVNVWFFNEDKSFLECSDMYLSNEGHQRSELKIEAKSCRKYLETLKRSHNLTAMDAQTDPKTSEFSDYLKPHSIISLMDVPIWLHGEMVGILCHEQIQNRREWTFEEQDFAASISYMISLSLETHERELAQRQIIESLEEKEVLLREIHHRVKNNMQIISSLLNLQSSTLKTKEMRDIFRESQNRIKSMSMIHEQLYQSKDIAKIDFGIYVTNLIKSLFQIYSGTSRQVEWNVVSDKIEMDIETALPCGLILNELVSNSLKHAFNGSEGKIRVKIIRDTDIIKVEVGDNGSGLPEKVQLETTSTLGLKLVDILVKQLEGELEIDRENGTCFTIRFRELNYGDRL
ncbi:histidine kinase dimerization/phosphoacceptor domain -containing protein [Methanobacterium aggregans]|uniref:histidine kinase dimerization/phosphoacceptor domain -containing protein n=1 Tax=Methanobacterium aggregans TaxID=1615586 RepID=UPI001AE11341|nr:histidine kinase dimerization/phosphoacceptor domain -containing protein [Methanobacterium aggregans]MBP2045015.1 PAS domain S-box-containing protein [Methanobacterium aggregans]